MSDPDRKPPADPRPASAPPATSSVAEGVSGAAPRDEGRAPPDGADPAAPAEEGAPAPRQDGGDLMGDIFGRLLRRGRQEMGRAARQARDRLSLRQLRLDRDRMYQKLGKEVLLLVESGDLSHPSLARAVERIRDLEGRIHEQEDRLRSLGLDPEEDTGAGGEGGGA